MSWGFGIEKSQKNQRKWPTSRDGWHLGAGKSWRVCFVGGQVWSPRGWPFGECDSKDVGPRSEPKLKNVRIFGEKEASGSSSELKMANLYEKMAELH